MKKSRRTNESRGTSTLAGGPAPVGPRATALGDTLTGGDTQMQNIYFLNIPIAGYKL